MSQKEIRELIARGRKLGCVKNFHEAFKDSPVLEEHPDVRDKLMAKRG